MDLHLTPEQLALKQAVADFARRELAAKAFAPESHEEYLERRRKLGEQGFLGLTAPVEYGGAGLPYFDALLAVEEMAKYCPRSADEMHVNGTGTATHFWLLGSPEQQERWLRPICEGKATCAIVITEPDAGSAATEMQSTAVDAGDHYVVNGSKIFITAGPHADFFVTYVRFGEGKGSKNIGAVIIEKGMPGFQILRNDRNMAGEMQSQLIFDNCIVPKRNLLAPAGSFGKLIRAYNRNRLSGCAQALGAAQGAYERALDYAKSRQQFGREIASFQGVQWMLADMVIQLNAARAVLYQACQMNDANDLDLMQISLAKVFVPETCAKICDTAIQIFGGYGYMEEYPVNQLYRRVRGTQIYGGTMQVHRNMIAGYILGNRLDQRKN